MMLIRWLFWSSLGLILYAYIGFPLLLAIRGWLQRRPVKKADIVPRVSLVITAHNEATHIGAKLENVLALDYPREQLEIIVASDGSNDGMNEIVTRYADRGVLLRAFPRQGKIPTLNAAAVQATGDILVFSDANSIYASDALRVLLRAFADPTVGAVGGNQVYISGSTGNTASFGERMYWGFDRRLKAAQTEAGNMISATGAIHAIRRELFRPVPLGVGDDFVISTRAISQGYRLVFEPNAMAYETIAPTDRAEFSRKERVIVRGLLGLWAVKELFNPLRYGFYAIQIFSHKLLRWSLCWLLVILFAASLALYPQGGIYQLAALGQILFYGSALAALALRQTSLAGLKVFRLLAIPYYFCLANTAAARAWVQLLGGKRIDVWDSKRHVGEAQSTIGSPRA
jgi:cellulose synthase/poly-beta-1,6-N-acetylglucosamine synthase-like glycosyltransferase